MASFRHVTGGANGHVPGKGSLDADVHINGATFPISPLATATSGLPISYAVFTPGVCTVLGTTVMMHSGGACVLNAVQAGNASYSLSSAAALVTIIPPDSVLDIYASDAYDAGTDGVMLLRYLFGLRGDALVANTLGTGGAAGIATRTDSGAIATYLDSIRLQLDVNLDGQVDALTDGSMIIRYMFGLRGDALIGGGVLGGGAVRNTAPLIEPHIQSLMP